MQRWLPQASPETTLLGSSTVEGGRSTLAPRHRKGIGMVIGTLLMPDISATLTNNEELPSDRSIRVLLKLKSLSLKRENHENQTDARSRASKQAGSNRQGGNTRKRPIRCSCDALPVGAAINICDQVVLLSKRCIHQPKPAHLVLRIFFSTRESSQRQ